MSTHSHRFVCGECPLSLERVTDFAVKLGNKDYVVFLVMIKDDESDL